MEERKWWVAPNLDAIIFSKLVQNKYIDRVTSPKTLI